MAQIKPQWEEIPEFIQMSEKLVSKYPDRFGHVDVNDIVAYGCINKERPESKSKLYEMSGEPEPENFTNSKKYFVKFFQVDWDNRVDAQKLLLVTSALSRIDPDTGKVGALDYRDQCVMVKTFGTDWQDRGDIPNVLTDSVNFRE